MQKNLLALSAAFLSITLLSSEASALDKIYSPNVEEGELSLEYAGSRTFDRNSAKDDAQTHEFDVEYGVGERVMLELATEIEQDPNDGAKFDHIGGEAVFQFFPQGENWLDSGLLVAYNMALIKDAPDAAEIKLLLEKDFGKFTSRANLSLEQEIGKNSNPNGPEYAFLTNTRYRLQETFQPGLELQSTFGHSDTLGHFNAQEHYIGPAVYGKLFGNLKYEAAYLLGFSAAASQGAGRVKLEYEVKM